MKKILNDEKDLKGIVKDVSQYSKKIVLNTKKPINPKDSLLQEETSAKSADKDTQYISNPTSTHLQAAETIQRLWRKKSKIIKENRVDQPKVETNQSTNTPTEQEIQAVRTIQKVWRGRKIKETVVKSPYFSYLSMIDPNDEQKQLSSIMFGRHVAEIRLGARERIDNPTLNTREFYHRSIDLSSILTDTLFKEFNITPDKDFTYIPLTVLKNNPIKEVTDLFPKDSIKLITKKNYSVVILKVSCSNKKQLESIKEKVKNMGLVASSWEIAENLKTQIPLERNEETTTINMDSSLPKTKEELLNSPIIIKLNAIATSGGQYPTKMLAKCLQKLLTDLPPAFDSKSIQRIALLLDLTNTFYSYNYPRYALCVYSILHEISLNLLKNKDPHYLDQEFQRFQEESSNTLNKILDIDPKKVTKASTISAATTSGVGACVMALRLASKMKTQDGAPPKVMLFKPCYYELPNISNLNKVEDSKNADILIISAGPIVNPEGLTPGVDINKFIETHVIHAKRKKPLCVVIDATTALYKNFKLNDNIKKLVEEGKVSIIIHESHQKFGLLHSDQAQYGRVFGWCSQNHFKQQEIKQFHENAREDFSNHLDAQIGAFVSTRCQKILEDIKARHFSNGAILRNLLIGTSLISKHVETHENMLENFDELYFLNDKETEPHSYTSRLEKAAFGVIDYRASFGHYAPATTGVVDQRRLSPDASSDMDALIQASHIRLSKSYGVSKLLNMVIEGARTNDGPLNLEEQIVTLSMLHNIISHVALIPHTFGRVSVTNSKPTEKEIKKILNSQKKDKDLLFIKDETKNTIHCGYVSGNQFKVTEVKDDKIIAMVKAGTISDPQNRPKITTFLKELQTKQLPKNTSLATAFNAIKNALEHCPSLKHNQYYANIRTWLNAVEEKNIAEYKPQNRGLFLKSMNILYSIGAPLKEAELHVLSQHPKICENIKANREIPSDIILFGAVMDTLSSMNILLKDNEIRVLSQHLKICDYIKTNKENPALVKNIILLTMNLSSLDNFNEEKFINLLKGPKFKNLSDAVNKIDEGNTEILNLLKNSPEKHEKACKGSQSYLKSCYSSLFDFYTKDAPKEEDKQTLIKNIKSAEKDYLDVLGKDRSRTSQAARIILSAITNFIVLLVAPIIGHAIHYKTTGRVLFFSETNSASKLKEVHKEVEQEINKTNPSSSPSQ